MGTGASGEMRETLPQMNSSSMRSPATRMRLAAKRARRALKRAASGSTGIGRRDLGPGLGTRESSIARLSRRRGGALARHHEERKARPGQRAVDTAPKPNGLVEDLEHGLIDVPRAEQFAVGPPRRRAGLVETGRGLEIEGVG